MTHEHPDHTHSAYIGGRRFAIGIGLNSIYVAFELIFGFLAGSLGLIADAGHNASDVLSLALAWFATYLATKPPSSRFT